jgi:uncharacterized damage-inducible protein DinB
MKNVFYSYAKYNQNVNKNLYGIILGLPDDQLTRKFEVYHTSIYDTLFHIMVSDLFWMKRIAKVFEKSPSLEKTIIPSIDLSKLKEDLGGDREKLSNLRGEVDQAIDKFVNDLQEADYEKALRYKNHKGEEIEKEIWKVLMHMFNHQTHHRGQVSELLDMLKIDNDYSSLLSYI